MRPDADDSVAVMAPRRRRWTLTACLLLLACPASAQDIPQSGTRQAAAARSGDAWIDRRLDDIDAYAARYPAAFIDELVRYFDVPRALVAERISAKRTMPGDVYYACALAQVAGKPCRGVLAAWERDQTGGWGPVAERLGVVVSAEHAARLRQSIERSYRHWARPQPASAADEAAEDNSGAGDN